MIKDMDARIAKAFGQVRSAFRAKLNRVNTAGPIALVQGEGLAGEQVQDAELFQQYGLTSNPPANSMAVILPVGGKSSHGIVIATEHGSYRFKELASGEVALYTDEGDSIVLKRGHVIEVTTRTLTINATTKVEMNTPLLQITGGDVKADTISLKNHRTSGVIFGNGTSSVPVV